MGVKFPEDVVPLTDLKVNPGRVIKNVTEAHRPLLLTSRGRGVAVVQSISHYELAEEERAFMRAVVAGLADLEAGREVSLGAFGCVRPALDSWRRGRSSAPFSRQCPASAWVTSRAWSWSRRRRCG